MATTVVGLFDDFAHAQVAANELMEKGFPREGIGVMANNVEHVHAAYADGQRDVVPDAGDRMGTGMAAGAVAGGATGLLFGLAAFAVPGIGPFVAAGTILSTITGALLGTAAGGIIMSLVEVGVPREYAGYYAEGVRRGGTLLTVATPDAENTERAAAIMKAHGAVDIDERASYWRQAGWTEHDPQAEPYTREQIEREREAYRARRAA
jgi:hypothetical protein